MKYYILDNGIPVMFYKMANTHSVTLGLYIRAGIGYKEEVVGITHLLEHLHFRRVGEFSQEELYYKMESMGSTLRAATFPDFMKYTMKIVPQYFEKCLKIFGDLIETYEWTEAEFEKEKQVVLNQILEKGNYISIDRIVRETIFRENPLSNEIMGSVGDIEVLQLNDILKYKKKVFNPQNMFFCVTGNIKDVQFRDAIKYLEKVTVSEKGSKNVLEYPRYFAHRKPDIVLVPVEDDNFLEVNISFDVPYDKMCKERLKLLNCILGEGVGSRLQKYIREENCYTSNISSYIEWYQKFAVLHIYFSVRKEYLLPCLKKIVDIIKNMKFSISMKELEISLPFYTTNQVFVEDDTEEMNFQLAYHNFVLETEFGEIKRKNNASTIFELEKYAGEIFVKNNMCIVIVGDTRDLSSQLINEIIGLL